jgi:hypothetical protein
MLVPTFWVVHPVGIVELLKFSVTGSDSEEGFARVVKLT